METPSLKHFETQEQNLCAPHHQHDMYGHWAFAIPGPSARNMSGTCPQSKLHRSCFQVPKHFCLHGTSTPRALGAGTCL